MLFYSKASQYALRALSFLVKNEPFKPCQATLMAKQEDIPKHFLSKILQQLVEAGILRSLKGPGGGFIFAREPKDISLYEVINVFDDLEESMNHCAIGWNECTDKNPCDLHDSYTKLRNHVKNYCETINMETFAETALQKRRSPAGTGYQI